MSSCAAQSFRVQVSRTVASLVTGKIWSTVRRDFKRGFSAAYHDYKTLPRIDSWQWPYWGENPHTVPVHIIAGADDWRMAAWALASWFCATDAGWPVVIHDDGTLPAEALEKLRELFGVNLIVVSRTEADPAMDVLLKAFPFCEEYRHADPRALKVFDIAQFTGGDRCIVLEPNVLFFKKPIEIVTWADLENEQCWFCEDAVENSTITVAEARNELDVKLWRRVDTGVCLLWKKAIDLDFVDRALAQTSVLKGPPDRVAGTLLALCASQHNVGGLLPKSYEVSLERNATSDAVSRHYLGAVRERFFAEGLKRLREPVLTVGDA